MTISRLRSLDIGDTLTAAELAELDAGPKRVRLAHIRLGWKAWNLGAAKCDTRFGKTGDVAWYDGVTNQNIDGCMPWQDDAIVEIMPAGWKPGQKRPAAPVVMRDIAVPAAVELKREIDAAERIAAADAARGFALTPQRMPAPKTQLSLF